jgi:SAM-dependent methyltransferase
MALDGDGLEAQARAFMGELDGIKTTIDPDFPWYPYGILNNFIHLNPIFRQFPLDTLVRGKAILDIGAADGDLSFFLERLGFAPEIIDHGPTNFNNLQGARLLARHLRSSVVIHDVNLDSYFAMPAASYDLVFFLGILYHLRNPILVMESLAKVTQFMLVSTRVARFAPNGQAISDIPVAYLVNPMESNNDSTNYWTFSAAGLTRLFDRTGWDVLASLSVGDTRQSEPARPDRDERAFALLRSRHEPVG